MDPVMEYDPRSLEESGWLPAVVNSQCATSLFVVTLRLGISAIVPISWEDTIAVGHFVKVRIRRNPYARPHYKAKHVVFDLCVLPQEEWPHSYIDPGRNVVMFETTAVALKFNRDGVMLLENDDLGLIIDVHGHVPRHFMQTGATIEVLLTTISSPRDRDQSIFIVQKVKSTDNHNENQRVGAREHVPAPLETSNFSSRPIAPNARQDVFSGYGVVGHVLERGMTFVWCPDVETDVIGDKICMPAGDLIGKWISFKAVHRNGDLRILENSVKIVSNRLPTQLINRIPQVRTTCLYRGIRTEDGHFILESKETGRIVDALNKIPADTYFGDEFVVWLQRHSRPEESSRWKVIHLVEISYRRKPTSVNESIPKLPVVLPEGGRGEEVFPCFGIVTHISNSGSHFIWCIHEKHEIIADKSVRWPKRDMLGSWISFQAVRVNGNLRMLVNSVEKSGTWRPTKANKKGVQVQASCVYRGVITRDQHLVLEDTFLGNIVDVADLIPYHASVGQKFEVVVMRCVRPEDDSGWKIVRLEGEEAVEQPKNETSCSKVNMPRVPHVPDVSDYGNLMVDDGGVYSDEEEEDDKTLNSGDGAHGTVGNVADANASGAGDLSEVVLSTSSEQGLRRRSDSVSATSTISSAAAEMGALTKGYNNNSNKQPSYQAMSALDMITVLLENPTIAETIQRTDMDAFVQMNNLMFS